MIVVISLCKSCIVFFLNNNSDAIYTLFRNKVLRYEANYMCTIILQRLRAESRLSGESVSLPSASGTSAG